MGSLNVHVTYSSGKGKKGARVVGENSNGMTKTVYTDARGHACVTWTSNTGRLTNVYVDGKRHKGPFQSGGTYSFPAG